MKQIKSLAIEISDKETVQKTTLLCEFSVFF